MSRAATQRLKVEPPMGMRPSLENRRIGELQVDRSYQRTVDTPQSQALIRQIAMFWDWRLFHPLSVVRRHDGSLWVIDGQHRLAAARMRKDLYDLPCVISPSESVTDEASAFVAMNRQRRPLSRIDVYRASLAAGDPEHLQAQQMIEAAGLSIAAHSNFTAWKPAQISNVGGVLQAVRAHGAPATSMALGVLAQAWRGEVLRYAGTILGGVVAAIAKLGADKVDAALLTMVLGAQAQAEWCREFEVHQATWKVSRMQARAEVIATAYSEASDDE